VGITAGSREVKGRKGLDKRHPYRIVIVIVVIIIIIIIIIPKSLSNSLTRLNLQKSVILSTCSIVRNFLNYK